MPAPIAPDAWGVAAAACHCPALSTARLQTAATVWATLWAFVLYQVTIRCCGETAQAPITATVPGSSQNLLYGDLVTFHTKNHDVFGKGKVSAGANISHGSAESYPIGTKLVYGSIMLLSRHRRLKTAECQT